jgi:hypothetical protein
MNSVDFCYWLQGFFELSELDTITPRQLEAIKQHLHLVFLHEIDPMRTAQTTTPAAQLDAVHHILGFNDPLVRC